MVNTDVKSWQSAAILTIENRDTVQLRDLSLFMRCDPLFIKSDSMSVNVSIKTPSEMVFVENMTISITPNRNKKRYQYRSVRAQIIEIPYRRNVLWSEVGEYQIAIYPTSVVTGVEAVGVVF